jgi:hypothetical protein
MYKGFPPFSKSRHTIFQIALGLELRVRGDHHVDIRQCMAHECPQMFGERSEGVITTLKAMAC